jgi:hypothetical protein
MASGRQASEDAGAGAQAQGRRKLAEPWTWLGPELSRLGAFALGVMTRLLLARVLDGGVIG